MISKVKAVGFDDISLYESALSLATELNIKVDNKIFPRLSYTDQKLVLLVENFSPLYVDFSSQSIKQRVSSPKKPEVVRAVKPTKGMKIIDATAGWGRDAAVLASFGADILLLEREPAMAKLLADGIKRIPVTSILDSKLSLIETDAINYLDSLLRADYPDIIYIDPMHPARQKSALVKKDLQALQQIIGADVDAEKLIKLAITRIKNRVVVKWPQRLVPLIKPNYSLNGKTVRFDVYTK